MRLTKICGIMRLKTPQKNVFQVPQLYVKNGRVNMIGSSLKKKNSIQSNIDSFVPTFDDYFTLWINIWKLCLVTRFCPVESGAKNWL